MTTFSSPKVAVIGAGAAGLSAARVLSREGVTPLVLEKDLQLGGVWKYVENSKTRPMYRGLKTNLPKEVMQFREKPWNEIQESFITHTEVLSYLQSYEKQFNLGKYISYGSSVKQLTLIPDQISQLSTSSEKCFQIKLEWERSGELESGIFDAVFVCNGHYSKPSKPTIPGLEEYFRGETMHSVSYDNPRDFKGKTVLCIGGRASGADLAREISFYADHVYLSDTALKSTGKEETKRIEKVTWVPKTIGILEDSSIQFEGVSSTVKVDAVIFCTGYDYEFPFINDSSSIELDAAEGERRVSPLFQQLWHARHPNLVFIGIPHSVVPFPLFELQAEAATAQFKNFSLPNLKERLDQANKDSCTVDRIQDTHHLGRKQWEYCLDLAKLAGICDENIRDYIITNKEIYDSAGQARKSLIPGGPDTYRDIVYKREGNKWKIVSSVVRVP